MTDDTVQHWLAGLRRADEACAQQLFHDVFERLVKLARRKLGGHVPRWIDEEDVALSAFDSFCRRVGDGRIDWVRNRDDLWKILVVVTARKAKDYLRVHLSQKRGGGAVRGDSAFGNGESSTSGGRNEPASGDPSPEIIAVVTEECGRLLRLLDDAATQSVAIWKLEGYGNAEIAAKLGCVERTVVRKLNYIRHVWRQISASQPHGEAADATGCDGDGGST